MLKSCSYCGKLHDFNDQCPKKQITRIKKKSLSTQFRKTYKWTNKSKEIRDRDNHMCQICIREFEGTIKKFNYDNIQAHHIIPISEDESLALDNENLISACKLHHDMAEKGLISRSELKFIAKDQEDKRLKDSPPIC